MVAIGHAPALLFEQPRMVLRTAHADGHAAAWMQAESALRDGSWIAGYAAYSGKLALGIFDAPREVLLSAPAVACISPLVPTLAQEAYATVIAQILDAIRDGDVYQVNYTMSLQGAYRGDPLALYAQLAHSSATPYAAFARDGTRAALSLSPELFLRIDGRRITTKPMKGTAAHAEIEALHDAKNRAEHVMIVDLLRNDLRRICADVAVERLFEIERYPTFAAMTSTISGSQRPDTSLADLFAATFPCGSVTGAPKEAAMAMIQACETREREIYCGSVGFLSPAREGWWNVAIRTLQLDTLAQTARLDVGGGIVADSTAAAECSEALLKARFVETVTAPFALWETFASDGDLQAHLRRLRDSAQQLQISFDEVAVSEAVRRHSAAARERSLVRLRLLRDGTFTLHSETLIASAEPLDICIAPQCLRSDDPWLAIKSSWRPEHDAASAFAAAHGCFDALLCNERDELVEGSRTTLFIARDGRLVTPPRKSGALPGILRERLLASGQAREGYLTRCDIVAAQDWYVGNSARGLLRARFIEAQRD